MEKIINFMKSIYNKVAAFFNKLFKKPETLATTAEIEIPEFVDYYGCPNSKKAQKLQLKKRVLK